MTAGDQLIPCVGAITHDRVRRLLLIRRGRPPERGRWSLPGGRVEPGETGAAAVVREVAEETGLRVRVVRLVGHVRRDAPSGAVYDIADYLCAPVGDQLPVAGDDADAVLWADAATYRRLRVVDGLTETLAAWGALPSGYSLGSGRPGCSPPRASP